MKKFLTISLLLATQAAYSATPPKTVAAKGNEGGGGGDEVGMEFVAAINSALLKAKTKNPALYLKIKGLDDILKDSQVIVVSEPLYVKVNNEDQESVAVNFPDKHLIKVNRYRWKQIQIPVMQEGIAVHEIRSLKLLERTGYYPVSGEYVAVMGSSEQTLANTITMPLTESVAGYGTVIVPAGKHPSEMDGYVYVTIKKCVGTAPCTEIPKDINGSEFKVGTKITLRPGRYVLQVSSYYQCRLTPKIYFQLVAGQSYIAPYSEFHIPAQQGTISAAIYPNLDDQSTLEQTVAALAENNLGGYTKEGLKNLGPVTYTNSYFDGYNYNYFSSVANSSLDPQIKQAAQAILDAGQVDLENMKKVRDYAKVSNYELSMVTSKQFGELKDCRDTGIGQLTAAAKAYFASNPNVFGTYSGTYDDKCKLLTADYNTFPIILFNLKVEKNSGVSVLLAPGKYVVQFQNEQGDVAWQKFTVGFQPTTIEVQP